MRPNVEIPWSRHGRIREWADENDLSVTEAYNELLERALESVETPDGN